jgi:hypothetical protein
MHTTYLQNVERYVDEFVSIYSQDAANDLLEYDGQQVTVVGEECDGFWNILLPNGRHLTGITWDCLEGFTEDTTEKVTTIREIVFA